MAFKAYATVATFLLLFPLAQAAGPALEASEVVVDGEGTLEALQTLSVLQDEPVNGTFQLHIAAGMMVTYEESEQASVGGAGVTPTGHSSNVTVLANATLDGFSLHGRGRLLVLPGHLRQATNATDGVVAKPSAAGILQFPPHASVGPAWTVDTSNSLELSGAAGDSRSQGAYQFIVWGASFVLHNSTGPHSFDTGNEDTPLAAPVPLAYQRLEREIEFRVDDGSILVSRSLPFRTFVSSLHLSLAAGALAVHDPTGTEPVTGSALAPGKRLLTLQAPFVADLSGQDQSVDLAFAQRPAAADLDGVALLAPHTGPPWLLGLGLVALVAVPAAAASLSRARLRRRLRELDRLVQAGRFGQAVDLARAIRRRRPREPDALVAQAMGLVRKGSYAEAARVLDAEGWTAALGPLRDFLRAAAAAGLGQRAEAARLLALCLAQAPDMASEAALDPLLAPVLGSVPPGGPGAGPGAA